MAQYEYHIIEKDVEQCQKDKSNVAQNDVK